MQSALPGLSQDIIYPLKKIDSLLTAGYYTMAFKINGDYLRTSDRAYSCGRIPLALFKAGEISDQLRHREDARRFMHMSLTRSRACHDDSVEWLATRYLGGIFHRRETRDSELFYLRKAYAMLQPDKAREISSVTGMLGESMRSFFNNTTAAAKYYKISLDHAVRSGDYRSLGYAYLRYGYFLTDHGNCAEGIPMLEKSLSAFSGNKDAEGEMWILRSLSRAYKACGHVEEAFLLSQRLNSKQDSLFNAETAKEAAQLQVLYETERKELVNLDLKRRNEVQGMQLENSQKRARTIAWFSGIGMVMLAMIFFLVYNRYAFRRKIEMEKKIQAEQVRLSRELHDNIGSQLSQLAVSLDNVSDSEETKNLTRHNNLLSEITRSTRDIINDLRNTIWAINKPMIPFTDFADKLKTSLNRLMRLNPQVAITYAETPVDAMLGPEEALNLLRICQEAVSNSLRHSRCSAINIRLTVSSGKYVIRIEDNGSGFDATDRKEGHYGLTNMEARAKESGYDLSIQSASGNGTTVIVNGIAGVREMQKKRQPQHPNT